MDIKVKTLKQLLNQHDWYYQYSEDPYIYQQGKENSSKIRRAIISCLFNDSEAIETTSMIKEFLAEKEIKCLPGDYHFYFDVINRAYQECGKDLRDANE